MKISWYEKYKIIEDVEVGACFCFSSMDKFYMKVSDGSCVCLSDGQIAHFNYDAVVIPVELKATAVRKTEAVPIEPLDK